MKKSPQGPSDVDDSNNDDDDDDSNNNDNNNPHENDCFYDYDTRVNQASYALL